VSAAAKGFSCLPIYLGMTSRMRRSPECSWGEGFEPFSYISREALHEQPHFCICIVHLLQVDEIIKPIQVLLSGNISLSVVEPDPLAIILRQVMQLGRQDEGSEMVAIALGGFRFWGILFDTRARNFFGSKTVSSKLVSDFDRNRVCSKNVSNSRLSMLCAPSLGKDRLLSR
jgi:hypothetical protein